MQMFLDYFDTGLKIYVAGVISYPVGKYLITRFGGALFDAAWEDVKKIAYKVWDTVKAKI